MKLLLFIHFILFVWLFEQGVNAIQCTKSLCDDAKCEKKICKEGQKLIPRGGFCGCCDACYDILGKLHKFNK